MEEQKQMITVFKFTTWYDYKLSKIQVDKVTNSRVTLGKSFANRVSSSAEFFTDFTSAKSAATARLGNAIAETKRKLEKYEEQLQQIASLSEDTVKEETTL